MKIKKLKILYIQKIKNSRSKNQNQKYNNRTNNCLFVIDNNMNKHTTLLSDINNVLSALESNYM